MLTMKKVKNNVDTYALGEAFLKAKHGQAWLVAEKTI